MSLNAGRTQIAALTRELLAQWELTKDSWRDAKAQEFEARFIAPLQSNATAALAAIEKLEKVISKARSDCE